MTLRHLARDGFAALSLADDADLAIAGTLLTGSWYAMAIAGIDPPQDWARRTAALVWRACGGDPPG